MNRKRLRGAGLGQPRLLLLALFFLSGIVLGQVLAGRVPIGAGNELRHYLTDYLRLDGSVEQSVVAGALPAALTVYFRYPLLAFLLSFASVGIVLLPAVTAAYGAFLSFSVCCFTASFGPNGVLLALAVFGPRCAVCLPCYFLLAVPSWGMSAALASLSFGRGRRAAPVIYGRSHWLRASVVAAVLLAGVCVELFLTPRLLRLALEHIFT